MAVYTPLALVPPTALTAVAGTSVFTGTAAHTYILRTISVSTPSSGKTFTMSLGADAAATRIFEAFALTANIPSIFNGWWVKAGAGAHDIDANVAATAASLTVGGYDYA